MKNAIKISLIFLALIGGLQVFGQSNIPIKSESDDTQYLAEEEKMAKDVYTYFGDKYGSRPFLNIQKSEQRHMDMMIRMLEKDNVSYKISDELGVFYDSKLQKLYTTLITQGSTSELEAFKVGKLIEEIDISDLKEAIKNTTDETNIEIYRNLLRASENHLQAFDRQIAKY